MFKALLKVLVISMALAFVMSTAVQALDFYPMFKGEKIAAMTIKKVEDGLDNAIVTTKSGGCFEFQMKDGKINAWKKCSEVEWKVNKTE